MEENVCPQERALESGIAPGSAYVTDLKARWETDSEGVVGEFGLMYEYENVCKQDVGETGDGGEGITIGLELVGMPG